MGRGKRVVLLFTRRWHQRGSEEGCARCSGYSCGPEAWGARQRRRVAPLARGVHENVASRAAKVVMMMMAVVVWVVPPRKLQALSPTTASANTRPAPVNRRAAASKMVPSSLGGTNVRGLLVQRRR